MIEAMDAIDRAIAAVEIAAVRATLNAAARDLEGITIRIFDLEEELIPLTQTPGDLAHCQSRALMVIVDDLIALAHLMRSVRSKL